MAKDTIEYRSDVFDLVQQIGKLAKVDVALYRLTTADSGHIPKWTEITPANPLYLGFYAYSGDRYGPFAVARVGQSNSQSLNYVVTIFHMYPFPGSCALGISSAAHVANEFQGRGINRLGLRLRQAIAGAAGYSGLVCTDTAKSVASIKTIEGAGFNKVFSTKNRRTGNVINAYIKELE